MENTALSEDFAAPYTAFSLLKDDGKIVRAVEVSLLVGDGCDGAETPTHGSVVTCRVVFDFDRDDEAAEFRFETPEGREGAVEVETGHICEDGEPACEDPDESSCPDGCYDLGEDDQNCGGCDQDCGAGTCRWAGHCWDLRQADDRLTTCDETCGEVGYVCWEAFASYNTSCWGDEDEDIDIACDEIPEEQIGCLVYGSTYCECVLHF